MTQLFTKANPRILSALAAGLMMATALTVTATTVQVMPVQAEIQQQAIDPSRGFADLVDRVMPSVISVEVKFANVAGDFAQDGEGGPEMSPGIPENSPFRDFFDKFGKNMPDQRQGMPRSGVGSGFIISADGYAVTNNHVVQGADEVTVKLRDGRELKAKVIGTDPKTDLALIKIDSNETFQFASFSDKEPRVGDWVMAVGNPFGLSSTVTTGIISASGRDIGAGPYDDFLQIDASINKGNSGGPAFDLEGKVIGINTAIYSPSGGSVGIGFAIPASTAETVLQSLKENGAVTRGWLGVQIQPVTDDIAESLGVAAGEGAIISDVTEDSPALKAGFKTGDIILKLDGKDISDSRDLARKVAVVEPGTSVPVEIIRDGKAETVTVEIGKMPGSKEMAAAPRQSEPATLADLGLKVMPADDGAGVKVTDVDPNGIAAAQGLRPGDVIVEVGGKQVHGMNDVKDALKASGKKRVLLLVRSGDSQRFVALPVEQG